MEKFSQTLKLRMQVMRLRLPVVDLTRRDVLLENLRFVYHMIKASENLLRVGYGLARDPMLKEYYLKHFEEEEGHAEWLQKDLIGAGVDFSAIPREAMLMAGVQYYFLFHVSPASLLGYMAALECFPTPMETIERLEDIHGTKILRTMRYHAEHDPQHGQDLLTFIDSRPYPEHNAILESAAQATHFMHQAITMMEVAHG